jgi:excisionase family DNA binding protein
MLQTNWEIDGEEGKNQRPRERLALSLKETASALGISYATVWRLVQRGKLRSVPGIRHHVIPIKEIERFLQVE